MQFLFRIFTIIIFLLPQKLFGDTSKRNLDLQKNLNNAKLVTTRNNINNFGMQGLISLPSASTLPDGEMIFYQINHTSLSRTGFTFQISPKIGLSFRYSGHGENGHEAAGRINHDRSFDVDFKILKEKKYQPAVSIGLRDFIGTGWYSSEYLVGTKNIGPFSISAGLGFGRIAGRNQIANPFSSISKDFKTRPQNDFGKGGTLGSNINWFQGSMSPFAGLKYDYNEKTSLVLEYSPDLMKREISYISSKSPINIGLSYDHNELLSLNAQYLHGSTVAVGANLKFNPKRPIRIHRDAAPLPLIKRASYNGPIIQNNTSLLKNALEVDKFVVKEIFYASDHIKIEIENKKYRSTAKALGRISRAIQRNSNLQIDYAIIIITSSQLPVASYRLDLQKLTNYQNNIKSFADVEEIITPQPTPASVTDKDIKFLKYKANVLPYFDYRLFDPMQPIRAEVGLKLDMEYSLSKNLGISSRLKKSLLTDFNHNIRYSDSVLPHVVSDFPIYDSKGQKGHIENLALRHRSKLSKNIYSSLSVGYLEPMYAGVSGELLYKNPKSNFAFGIDLNAIRMREYEMLFGLRNYKTISSHLNLYYDAGKSFDLEMNIGKYLAKDYGVTTKISRRFGNGWSVGAYATFTDVSFDTYGEGSFDKGFYLNIPSDWIFGRPVNSSRRIDIRPITRDGGAILNSSKTIYNYIRRFSQSEVKREYGRFLK